MWFTRAYIWRLCSLWQKHIDKDITKSRRRMGAIVETPSIYVDLTAYENLKEQYKVLGIPSDDGISEILKLVGLENTGNKKAKNFSLGMRQRLGIAVALAGSPDFLVLDEPVNGLDPQGIIEIRELILKLNQEHGITVLISSHILDELSKLATYYGFIDNGKMIKQISSIELESKCRKCTHLKVSSTKTLAYVLDTMNIEYKILSNTEADIFEKVNISKLTTELSKKDCEVISIHEHDESLESYFVSLVGVQDMNKLLSANFFRLRKNKCFWGSLAFMFVIGIASPLLRYRDMKQSGYINNLDNGFFMCALFIGIILAVFCSLFIGTEHNDGTIRNKIIVGQKRETIYLSNMVTCSIIAITMCIVFLFRISALEFLYLDFLLLI